MRMLTSIRMAVNTRCRYTSQSVARDREGDCPGDYGTSAFAHLAQFWHTWRRHKATHSDMERH